MVSKMSGKKRKELLPKPSKDTPREGTACAKAPGASGLSLESGLEGRRSNPLGELSTGTVETWKDRIVLVERALGGKRVVVEVSTDKPTLTVDQKPESLGTMMDARWGGRGSPCWLLGAATGCKEVGLCEDLAREANVGQGQPESSGARSLRGG